MLPHIGKVKRGKIRLLSNISIIGKLFDYWQTFRSLAKI